MDQPTTTFEKPRVNLTGTDSNVFTLLGRCTKVLKTNGLRAEANELAGRVLDAGSYDEALQVMMQYVEAS